MNLNSRASRSLVFSGYLVFFLLLFAQFPLSDSLFGKTDSWYHLAISNEYGNFIWAYLSGTEVGNAYYPAECLLMYGEPAPGGALLYLLMQGLVHNPIWAFFLFYSLLFSLNSFGLFLLSKRLRISSLVAVIIGLLFSCSNYTFGHLDHQNTLSWFPAFLALERLLFYLESNKRRHLFQSALWAASTIYFSGYVFLFMGLIMLLICIFNLRRLIGSNLSALISAAGLGLLIILPYVLAFVTTSRFETAYNPGAEFNGAFHSSLFLIDLLRSLEGNLIYPLMSDIEFPLLRVIRSANTGLTLAVLCLVGAVVSRDRFLILLWLMGMIVSLGPEAEIFGRVVPLPMNPLYSYLGFESLLRTPVRAYFICLIAMLLLAGRALDLLQKRKESFKWLIPLFCFAFFIENIPMPFAKYDSGRYVELQQESLSYLKSKESTGIMVYLPSSLFTDEQELEGRMNEFGREQLYAYWQTQHGMNSLNGSAGFFPEGRVRSGELLTNLSSSNIGKLIDEFAVSSFVFHPNLIYRDTEQLQLAMLRDHPRLRLAFEGTEVLIFELRDYGPTEN